jgi:predicted MFS family arabinose efflux permease
VAVTGTLAVALTGHALAAAGTGVLFPTLIVVLTARVPDCVRGSATSAVTTVAYVGAWADAVGLRGAMLAVAALALALATLAAATVRSRLPSTVSERPHRSPIRAPTDGGQCIRSAR